MQLTRQEQLDFITHKIARTWWGTWPWETGYYLPVMIGDVLDAIEWMWYKVQYSELWEMFNTPSRILKVLLYWKNKRESLDKQSDQCISYIFNLISHV